MKYPDAWFQELIQRSDIVSLVSDCVQLKEKGGRYWGLCPFHSEKTPSFSVSADKQVYYCFGCHAGGNVIHFLMEKDKLTFTDAVETLARRVGLALPEHIDDEALRKAHALKEQIYEICRASAVFYHEKLLSPDGLMAREYLASRGIGMNTVVEFGLGYSPQGWDELFNHLTGMGLAQNAIIAAGVCVSKRDRVFDAYRNRLIFPIIGVNNRVLGFGARTLTNETPKYINTPETPVFNKRQNLYGLNLVKSGRISSLILVEGYMDVIGLWQRGVKNAVASLGTALTPQQAKLCKRYCDSVYIAYDGDAAGQNATLRGLDILAAEGLSVKIVALENGEDPDDFIRAHGQEAFEAKVGSAIALNGFKLEHIKRKFDLNTEDGIDEYAIEACEFISTLGAVEQERYYAQLAKETNFSVAALKKQGEATKPAGKNSIVNYRNNRSNQAVTLSDERIKVERALMFLAVKSPEDRQRLLDNIGQIKLPAHLKLAEILQNAPSPPDFPLLIAQLEPQDAELAAAIMNVDQSGGFEDALKRIIVITNEERIAELKAEMTSSETSYTRRLECLELMRQIQPDTERIE